MNISKLSIGTRLSLVGLVVLMAGTSVALIGSQQSQDQRSRASEIVADVVWTSIVNATATGGTLTKTSGGTGWNAGGISSQQIGSGGGYAEMIVDNKTYHRFFGLNHNNTGTGYAEIDYAFYTAATGGLYIYENGVYKLTSTYAVGNTLKVAVEGGVVKYYKNTTLLYTSTQAPIYPLFVDTSLYQVNAKIPNAKIASGTVPTPTPTLAPTNTPTPTPVGPTPTPTPTPAPGSQLFLLCIQCNVTPNGANPGNRFSGKDFTGGYVPEFFAPGVNLSNSNFTGVYFRSSVITNTNLAGSNFTNADFTNADLTGATTTGATFTGATWSNTICPDGTNSNANGGTCAGHL